MPNFRYLHNVCEATIFLIALNLRIDPLLAQTVTQNLLREEIPALPQRLQVPLPLPPRIEPLLKPDSPLPLKDEIPNKNQKIIKVKRFVFKGNTVFSNKQLEAVVAPYTVREITFAELLSARAAITKLYVDRGYISSGAFFPVTENQAVQASGAVVTIQIVEGKLEGINVSGSSRLRLYIRSRLTSATSPVLNSDRLIEALQLLQIDPLIETITAELSEGSELGKTLLNVRVKARQPFKVEAVLDNSRSRAVGSFERRIQVTHANLLGLGDKLSVGYRNTDGSNAVEASYSVPINSQNGTVQFSYTNVSSNVIQRPFNKLDILSDARIYEVTLRQPLLRRASTKSTQEFALGLTGSRLESESSLLNTPFPLSNGADSRGRTRISAFQFFQEWTERSGKEVLFARSQFSLGIGAIEATINSSGPDSRFFAWQGQAVWLHHLIGKTTLLMRTDLHIADRPLVALEQFGLGGATTVRGYPQDTFLTDNGFLFSAEVHIPVRIGESFKLQLIPFIDVGTAWNNNAKKLTDTSQSGTLASLGLGIQYQLGDRVYAQLDWGIPLIPIENNSTDRTWQENGIYFNLRYQPF